MIYRRK